MNDIGVSIIIPVYNAEAFLRECLDSVMAQDYSDVEAIMVNDGSTDGSRAIMEQYSRADNRFICIDQENRGVGEARNAGLDASTGRYILFLDADDELDKNTLSELIPLAESNDIDMIQMNWWRSTPEDPVCERKWFMDRVLGRKELLEIFVDDPEELTYIRMIYKAEVIKSNNIRFMTRFCEDSLFIMQTLFCCEKFLLTNKRYYHYRENATGLVGTFHNDWHLNIERNKAMHKMLELADAAKDSSLTQTQTEELRKKIIRRAGSRLAHAQHVAFLEQIEKNNVPPDAKIAFWGAGRRGQSYIRKLNGLHLKNAVFVDNDPAKRGGEVLGYPVLAPSDLRDAKYDGYRHFIAVLDMFDVFAQMKELGFVNSFMDTRLDIGENEQYDIQLQAADELFNMIAERGAL